MGLPEILAVAHAIGSACQEALRAEMAAELQLELCPGLAPGAGLRAQKKIPSKPQTLYIVGSVLVRDFQSICI